MRHCLKIPRVSKNVTAPNRYFSNDGPTLSHPSLSSQIRTQLDTDPPRTFPMDENLFSEHPLIFDTHKMVSYLREGGFSQAQSESVTEAMVRVSQHANRHHTTQMVTKNEFVSLRSELSILEKADFALLKTDINAIEKRMETSVAEIYTAVERVENRVIKWVIAVAGAVGFGIIRLISTSSSESSSSAPRIGVPPPPSQVAQLPKYLKRKGLQILVT